ncbi:MAG: hypothetical protein ACR2F6_10885 [Mycobacteriales bacterium]
MPSWVERRYGAGARFAPTGRRPIRTGFSTARVERIDGAIAGPDGTITPR